MPDRADVALAILTLVLAVVAGVGRLLLGVLACGERLLLALWRRRAVIRALRREHVRMPDPSNPFHSEATARGRVERQRRQKEVRSYALARLHNFIISAGQE